jgi:hypothetical protein
MGETKCIKIISNQNLTQPQNVLSACCFASLLAVPRSFEFFPGGSGTYSDNPLISTLHSSSMKFRENSQRFQNFRSDVTILDLRVFYSLFPQQSSSPSP